VRAATGPPQEMGLHQHRDTGRGDGVLRTCGRAARRHLGPASTAQQTLRFCLSGVLLVPSLKTESCPESCIPVKQYVIYRFSAWSVSTPILRPSVGLTIPGWA